VTIYWNTVNPLLFDFRLTDPTFRTFQEMIILRQRQKCAKHMHSCFKPAPSALPPTSSDTACRMKSSKTPPPPKISFGRSYSITGEWYRPIRVETSIYCSRNISFRPMAQQPLVAQGLLIIEASRSHSDTPHSVGLLWTRDQPDADTPTGQHTTLTRDKHPCPRRDSNSQSQHASGRRPRP
jgi:hypothetical protein